MKGEFIIDGGDAVETNIDTKEAIWKMKWKDAMKSNVLSNLLMKKKGDATEVIVHEILKDNHIYTTRDDERSEMWIYHEGIYISQGKTFIREACRELLGNVFTTHLSNEVIAKIETDTYIDADKFFSNNNVEEVAVENGILNIFTRGLRDFTPDEIFFNKLPVKYDKIKKCPVIKKHLKSVLKEKGDVPVLEELFGYLLLKDYRFEKAFMFSGDGRNGKGKTLELMKKFIGPDNCANIPIQQFETDPYSLGELFNKMANLSGDVDRTALWKTGNFKNLTGMDLISAQRKFLTRVHFVNYAKMIFCTNNLPKTYDTTPAFWNRWILIEFPFTFVSKKELDALKGDKSKYKLKDPRIIDKLTTPSELSGLLNSALHGLKRLIKKKDFSYSKNTADVKNMWIRKSDNFTAFLMDNIEEHFEGKITKMELRHQYSLYCKKYRTKAFSDKVIIEVLAEYGASSEREQIKGKPTNYWWGIQFKGGKVDEFGYSKFN